MSRTDDSVLKSRLRQSIGAWNKYLLPSSVFASILFILSISIPSAAFSATFAVFTQGADGFDIDRENAYALDGGDVALEPDEIETPNPQYTLSSTVTPAAPDAQVTPDAPAPANVITTEGNIVYKTDAPKDDKNSVLPGATANPKHGKDITKALLADVGRSPKQMAYLSLRDIGGAIETPRLPDGDDYFGSIDAKMPGSDYTGITRGKTSAKQVCITFDGGGEDDDAISILDTLREKGIKTTLFLTGRFIKKHPDAVRQMVRDGHEIGNHSMNHPHLTDYEKNRTQKTLENVTKDLIRRELREAAAIFKEITGVEMSPVWRAPYGETNREINQWAVESGYVHVGWTTNAKQKESLDTLDWVSDRSSRLYRTASEIKKKVLGFGKDGNGVSGGIILMHLGSDRKTDKPSDILGEMVDALRSKGYKIVKVSAFLRGNKTFETLKRHGMDDASHGIVSLEEALPVRYERTAAPPLNAPPGLQ